MAKKPQVTLDPALLVQAAVSGQAGSINLVWMQLRELHREFTQAGRKILMMGIKAIQIKCLLPHGEFKAELEKHCPGISYRTLANAMKCSRHVCSQIHGFSLLSQEVQLLHFSEVSLQQDALSRLEKALTSDEEPALLAEIDALIEGKSGRQLVFEARAVKQATKPEEEPEAKEFCEVIFDSHERGPELEARFRLDTEAGEATWGECKRDIKAVLAKRNDLTQPPDPEKVKASLKSGLHRLNTWANPKGWEIIAEAERPALLEAWGTLLEDLNPDFRVLALQKLKPGRQQPST